MNVLALDVRSSSVRAAVYDGEGRSVEGMQAKPRYRLQSTPDGGVEADAEELFSLVSRVVDGALSTRRGPRSKADRRGARRCPPEPRKQQRDAELRWGSAGTEGSVLENGRLLVGLDEQPRPGKERWIFMAVLKGERVLLRPGRPEDADALVRIRNEPEVARWWGDVVAGEVEEAFVGNERGFVIEVDGEVVGAIQYEEEDDPMYRHAGIDVFLAASRHGRGLGTEAVRLLARHLFEERGHHRLTIDPAADNAVAIRAYEKAGFRAVGIMRSYERGPDGTWHDGLLMDMLREELCP